MSLRNPFDFSVQPYEQLIYVFRQMGLRDDAREVAIAKQKAIQKQRKGLSRFWSWILGVTIDYGYRPQKVVLLFILPILLLGILVFYWAFSAGLMEPTNNQQASQSGQMASSVTSLKFDSIGYSVDVFLPIVDLHQEDAWKPNLATVPGIIVQYYMYFQILAGWFFTTLAVAAVTGLVRSD